MTGRDPSYRKSARPCRLSPWSADFTDPGPLPTGPRPTTPPEAVEHAAEIAEVWVRTPYSDLSLHQQRRVVALLEALGPDACLSLRRQARARLREVDFPEPGSRLT